MSWEEDISKAEEFIWLCQDLQTEKDGVIRPGFMDFDKSKTLDQFAMDINKSATYISSLGKLIPMMNDLSKLGRKLEAEGTISVTAGDGYSRAVLDYLMAEYNLEIESR